MPFPSPSRGKVLYSAIAGLCGLGIIGVLQVYPASLIAADLTQAVQLIAQSNPQLTGDRVTSTGWWQFVVQAQLKATQSKQYNNCLFGDSISSGLGDTLGEQNFNFAIGGMSTVSLIEQLKVLVPAEVKCQRAIVAIGTNDAMYGIDNKKFLENMEDIIALLHSMGDQDIVLIPAFYSTVAASYNPNLAGTIQRVDEINNLINQVAMRENLPVETDIIQPLFKNHALKENLTVDGVHLNTQGLAIYKKALLSIINSPSMPHSSKEILNRT